MPMVEPIKMQIEITISYHATVLKQILVNIAMGEVNGIYEQMTIKGASRFLAQREGFALDFCSTFRI